MDLHIAAHAARIVLELTGRRFERFPNGDLDVLIGVVELRCPIDDDLVLRDREVDADAVKPSLSATALRRGYDHAAARDAVGEPIEALGVLSNACLDSFPRIEILERDLKGKLDRLCPVSC